MPWDTIQQLIRIILQLVGGVILGQGWLTEDMVTMIAGGGVSLVSTIWWLVWNQDVVTTKTKWLTVLKGILGAGKWVLNYAAKRGYVDHADFTAIDQLRKSLEDRVADAQKARATAAVTGDGLRAPDRHQRVSGKGDVQPT